MNANNTTYPRAALMTALFALMTGALAGCGLKGPLEHPPQAQPAQEETTAYVLPNRMVS